jgi:hypothetical protein
MRKEWLDAWAAGRAAVAGAAVVLVCAMLGACHKGSQAKANGGAEPVWKCRVDGTVTNWSALQVRQMMGSNDYRAVETPLTVFLLKCPKCGKYEMEQVMTSTKGGAP